MYSPVVVKFVVRHVSTSDGTSEVIEDLTEDMEDVSEAVRVPRDSLSIPKRIHKPDPGDIDGYRFSNS